MWSSLSWVAGAAASVAACALVAPDTTPVDRALPVAALLICFAAWLIRESPWFPAVSCGVPLLVAAAISFQSERERLLAYGVVVGLSFAAALIASRGESLQLNAGLAASGVVLLRWIGRSEIEWWREAFLLLAAVAIVLVMRRTAFAVAVALVAVLVTPAVPMRTLLIPVVAAVLGAILPIRLTIVPALIVALTMTFFPFSGIAARVPGYFFRSQGAGGVRHGITWALGPGRSATYEVPPRARFAILSGANVASLPEGAPIATMNGRVLRHGELVDWGASRRRFWWNARVALPAAPAGTIRGYGYDAWVDGAARIPLEGARRVTFRADPRLPSDGSLQVEAFEE